MRKNKIIIFLITALLVIAAAVCPAMAAPAAQLTIADMVRVAKHLTGQAELTVEEMLIYDLNEDGEVNVADLVGIARRITAGAQPELRPDYSQIIYSQAGKNVTVGDLTQIGCLVAGMLGDADRLDFAADGIPCGPFLAGICSLYEIGARPEEYPVAGPMMKNPARPVSSALAEVEVQNDGDGELLCIPRTAAQALAREVFGTAALDDEGVWTDGWFAAAAGSCAQEVTLVQFARYRHTVMALAVYDVTIGENSFGLTPGKVRIGMQFTIDRNSMCICPTSLMRLGTGQLEQESDQAAVFYPATVPV